MAESLAELTHGKVRVEDAGFDWKVLGPEVGDLDYVAWVCDQDAYAATGQKCSAQSMLFAHDNWVGAGLLEKMAGLAARRSLDNLTIGPVLTESTPRILEHMQRCLKLPGAKLLFGGKELANHSIPEPCAEIASRERRDATESERDFAREREASEMARRAAPHLASPRLASPHLTSPHLTSSHLISSHLTFSYLLHRHTKR